MAAVLKHWREAATLILVTSANNATRGAVLNLTGHGNISKDNAPKVSKTVENFEVLMLKRSGKSKFMPNLYVFPGGVAADIDFSPKWLSVFNKMGSDMCKRLFETLTLGSSTAAPMFTRQRDPAFTVIPPEVAFRICAIRETFEESGVLLVQSTSQLSHSGSLIGKPNSSLKSGSIHENIEDVSGWRERVNKDPNEFLKMCEELDLIPEIWTLYEWSDWLTPVSDSLSSHRFDTVFYVCCVDHKPAAQHDFSETVNSIWGYPSSILSAYFRQKSGVAPPQVYELSRLLNFNSISDLLKLVSQPDRERVVRWCPIHVKLHNGSVIVMPGDDFYPSNADVITQKNIISDLTVEQLSTNYPNHNRIAINIKDVIRMYDLDVNILPRKGHVLPNLEIFNTLKTHSML